MSQIDLNEGQYMPYEEPYNEDVVDELSQYGYRMVGPDMINVEDISNYATNPDMDYVSLVHDDGRVTLMAKLIETTPNRPQLDNEELTTEEQADLDRLLEENHERISGVMPIDESPEGEEKRKAA